VLFGVSTGMSCWFEAAVTDSFGLQLEGLRDGLGFLADSACPHDDGEERRRPRYRELVDSGIPEGVAAEDGVGLHSVGTELCEVVTCRPGATAFRVTRDGESASPRAGSLGAGPSPFSAPIVSLGRATSRAGTLAVAVAPESTPENGASKTRGAYVRPATTSPRKTVLTQSRSVET